MDVLDNGLLGKWADTCIFNAKKSMIAKAHNFR